MKIRKSRLEGTIKLSGAKNSALKLLSASILTDEPIELENSPNSLLDMQVHIAMLEKMGKSCLVENEKLTIEENKTLLNELMWDESQ